MKDKHHQTPLVKGGQGRTAGDVACAAYVTLASGLVIVVLLLREIFGR